MIRIQQEDFDVGRELARMRETGTEIGALATFVGLMRDLNDGQPVACLELEHYPGMTERALEQIVNDARERWPLLDVTVIHRIGSLEPGEQIVVVAVASRHRSAAFEACEFIMDYLKTRAPFWKKELKRDGSSQWLDSRASDTEAANRWRKPGKKLKEHI